MDYTEKTIEEIVEMLAKMPEIDVPYELHDAVFEKIKENKTPIELMTKEFIAKKKRVRKVNFDFLNIGGRFENFGNFKQYGTIAAGFVATVVLFTGVLSLVNVNPTHDSFAKVDAASAKMAELPTYSADEMAGGVGARAFSLPANDVATEPIAPIDGILPTELKAYSVKIENAKSADSSIKQFNITIVVDDIQASIDAINGLSGYNINMNTDFGDGTGEQSAYISRRVNSTFYETSMETLKTLGEVTNESQSEQKIANEISDNKASLKAKEVEIERILTLLKKSENVAVMVAIENSLATAESQRDGYKATLLNYENQINNPTLTINLVKKSTYIQTSEPETMGERVSYAFKTSVQVCLGVLEWVIVKIANLFVPVCLVIAVFVAFIQLKKVLKKPKRGVKHDTHKKD